MFQTRTFFKTLFDEVVTVSVPLFKLMIPIILLVKVLEEIGAITLLGQWLGPLMALVGLPEEMGLVWAATIATNIYGGMIVLYSVAADNTLTVAQMTVLGGLLLMAHGLPIETRIAQLAGMRMRVAIITRMFGAFAFAWLLHMFYDQTQTLQEPAQMMWQPQPIPDGLVYWFLAQAKALVMIQIVIIILLTFLKIMRMLGVEKVIQWMLRPLLKLVGIGKEATTITLVGITLGIAFGGGLLIKEAHAGHVSKKDVFTSLILLGFCHSLIEDTLLVILLGAHLSGVLWFRLVFAFMFTSAMSYWLTKVGPEFQQKHLMRP
ncbi:hypothetical protein N8381_02425 [Oceanospirillaceae bacterium]|nr:hypothetical protein [Oceanospirillaceae bacterium]MDC1340612.1 hypothetical protein [Oceanospirillaceae bacterium]MDC1509557.1 hypothetical protein [Oceanospirillaceae bacterium]